MNNYLNYPYEWYREGRENDSFFPPMQENMNLYTPKQGFERGNLFQNLYSQYKNYQPQSLNPKTEQEKAMRNLQALTFAMHDLNLYLDLHPEDQSMVMLFKDYQNQQEKLIREYESQYGPLTVSGNSMENGFSWVNTPWPWEVDNV